QPEHGLERQRRQDRQVGIRGLPAPARAPLGLPRLDRLVRKPDRQAAAPAQALVVLAPVRDLALLLRDVAAAVLVQLEGQGGHPGSDGGLPCYLDRAPGATRGIPATTWRTNRLLLLAASLLFGCGGSRVLALLRDRQRHEGRLLVETRDALRHRLEIEAQGPLHRDLQEAELPV